MSQGKQVPLEAGKGQGNGFFPGAPEGPSPAEPSAQGEPFQVSALPNCYRNSFVLHARVRVRPELGWAVLGRGRGCVPGQEAIQGGERA